MSNFTKSDCVDYVIDSKDNQNITNIKAKEWWDNIASGKCKGWNKQHTKDENKKTAYFINKSYGHSNKNLLNNIEIKYLNNRLDSMLEIGAGYGRETSEFIKRYKTVCVADIAGPHISIIKEMFPTVIAKEYNGVNIPYENNYFNLVYSCFVLQHVSKANAINLLNESIRVLKSGGIFVHEFLSGQYCGGTGKDHLSGGTAGMFNNGYYKDEILEIVKNLENVKLIECTEKVVVNEGKEKGLGNIWLTCQKI